MSDVVLVTGAGGFVGSHLVRALVAGSRPSSIVAWRRATPVAHSTSPPPPRPMEDLEGLRWQNIDLLNAAEVASAIDSTKPTVIYHCAGAASVHGSWDDTLTPLEGNVRGTDNLLRAVASSGLRAKVLVPGSALVYRPSDRSLNEEDPLGPVSPYAVSKLAQEMLARRYADEGLDVLVTRSFTHIGPGQALSYAASSFAHQIARIEAGMAPAVIRVGSLDSQRDLTDVRDTVRAYLLLIERGTPGRPYNVCSGVAHRIGRVLDGLIAHATVPVKVERDQSRLRPSDNPCLLGDPARITRDVGWTPRLPLSQTLHDLLDYWRRVVA